MFAGVSDPLLGLPLKILSHPFHLFNQEIPMVFLLGSWLGLWGQEVICAGVGPNPDSALEL